jgi:hypothetical protein
MSDPTFIACPYCGEPVVMTEMQHDLFRGRALACLKCAKQFTVDPQRTPLFRLSAGGRAYLSSPPPQEQPEARAAPATATIEGEAPQPAGIERASSPALSYGPGEKPRRNERDARLHLPAYFAAGVVLVTLLLAVIVLPPMTSARAAQRQLNCASNLRQISIALQVYAASNNGQFPDTLGTLVSSSLLKQSLLVCPAVNGPVSSSSYIYLGKGMTTAAASNPQTVILYEPLANHGASKGTHVLYANGTIAFVVPPLAQQTVQALSIPGATTAPSALSSGDAQ